MPARALTAVARACGWTASVAVHWLDAGLRVAAAVALVFLGADAWSGPPGWSGGGDARERLRVAAVAGAMVGARTVAARVWRERRARRAGAGTGRAAPTPTA